MSHFLDRLTFFRHKHEPFANGHGVLTEEDPQVGERLPKPLVARQNRPFHPRRELYRFVLVENLR